MSAEEQAKRFRDLELLVNRLQEHVKQIEIKQKETLDEHRNQCPFAGFKGDFTETLRTIRDDRDKDKAEIYGALERNKQNFWKVLGVYTTIGMFMLGLLYTLSEGKVSNSTFHESISILNKTQERQIEIYERLLEDINGLKVDTAIIKNTIESYDAEEK